MSDRLKIILGFAIIYLVWGSTYLAIKFGIATLPPFMMMGVRFWIAGLLLYLWLTFKGQGRISSGEWISATILATTMIAFGTGVVAWAEEFLDSGLTALLLSVTPIWMVFLEALQPGGRKPGLFAFLGILCGLLGVFVLVGPEGLGKGVSLLPLGILLVSSLSWAIGSIYARHHKTTGPPLKGTSLQMMIGGLMLLLMGLIRGESSQLATASISWSSIAAVAYLIGFGSLLVFPTYVWLMKKTSPGLVGTHAYVNPVVALFLGWLVADEAISPAVIGAGALILCSIVLLSLDNRRAATGDSRRRRILFRRRAA